MNVSLVWFAALAPVFASTGMCQEVPILRDVPVLQEGQEVPVLQDIPMVRPLLVGTNGATTRTYDVLDLLMDEGSRVDPQLTRVATQELVDVLLDVMDKRKRGLESIEVESGGHMVVKGAPLAHEYTRDFLAAQRQSPTELLLKMTLVEIPTGHLTEFGVQGSSATFNSPAEFAALLKRMGQSEEVTMVSAPQVLLQPRGRANISTSNKVSYVSDYVLQIVEPGNMEILDPVVEVIEEGVSIDVRAVPVPGGVVQFDMAVNFAVLQRPIPTVKTRIRSGKGPEVEISMPEVDHIKLNSVITLPQGSAALISSAAPNEGKDFVILLQYVKPKSVVNARVNALFESMRNGTYEHRWFPELGWEDVPSLLNLAQSERELSRFPTNPLSSQSMSVCLEGTIALWLIEGLQESGNLPSLNPILLEPDSGKTFRESLDLAQQKIWLAKARTAYQNWWKEAEKGRKEGYHALEGSGLSWY
ncbi:MAG: hypothetical protein KDB61_00950 [Planctomycetes bacterium]|nr:hypothetical protein [Planctomycetota bacterium]